MTHGWTSTVDVPICRNQSTKSHPIVTKGNISGNERRGLTTLAINKGVKRKGYKLLDKKAYI